MARRIIYTNDTDIACGYHTLVSLKQPLDKASLTVYISRSIASVYDIAPGIGTNKLPLDVDITKDWAQWFPWKTGAVIKFHLERGDKIIFYDKYVVEQE